MTLPTRLRIVHRDYTIEPWPPNLAVSANHLGECDANNGIIRICEDLEPDHERYVLVHEILHALYHAGDLAGREEESLVTVMAALWLQVWRDNPNLREYLNAV